MPQRLFDPVVPLERLHPAFASIRTFPGSEPTRLMLEEVFATFDDTDGNFVEQFQTTGFDARIFELFLHAYFSAAQFIVVRPKEAPDFLITREGLTVAVEATTSNPTQGLATASVAEIAGKTALGVDARPGRDDMLAEFTPEERERLILRMEHEFPIKLGSALYSKLSKRYWERDGVRERPFVIAIEAFHAEDSLYFSSAGLSSYLYGIKTSWVHDAEGKLVVTNESRDEHRVGAKVVPSNFFAQPGAENISAVLFTNSGTTAKFARMGFQAGMHRGNVLIARSGFFMDPDPNSATPRASSYMLDEAPFYEEWGHGVTIFHNPNAIRPIPLDYFPMATQVYMRGKDLLADGSLYSPYTSQTVIVNIKSDTFVPVELSPDGVGSLLQREFEACEPMRAPMTEAMLKEVAWFSNRARTIIGVVFQDRTDEDYNFAVLGRDSLGRFRAIEIGACYDDRWKAHEELINRIKSLDAEARASSPKETKTITNQ